MRDLQGNAAEPDWLAMAVIWCNGEWQDSNQSGVSWSDRGLMHGLGLFETLLALDGAPVQVERHLARLQKGLDRFAWTSPEADLKAAMTELLERNSLTEGRARIRLAITGGSGVLNDLGAGKDQKLWMTASALTEGKSSLSLGLSLWRRNADSPLVGLKCASYAENLMAMDWAREAGFDDVLFVNTAGNLCEAAMANLFLVKDGALLTPNLESGCLPGVTRELVLELARGMKIPVFQESLSLTDLKQADECFLTSATRGPVPVSSFEGRSFEVGPVTARLAQAWEHSLSPH